MKKKNEEYHVNKNDRKKKISFSEKMKKTVCRPGKKGRKRKQKKS